MDFSYADYFKAPSSTGYETLLYDVMMGDATLFQRADMVEAGWAAVQPILDTWARHASEADVHAYWAGSHGPAAADRLLERDGRHWLPLATEMSVRLVVSDVDGTIVRTDKSLAPSTIAAAKRLQSAGVPLAIVSARPPRGMRWIQDALQLTGPLAGFNGGSLVGPDQRIIEQRLVPEPAARTALALFRARDISAWLFTADEWLVLDPNGPHVDARAPHGSLQRARGGQFRAVHRDGRQGGRGQRRRTRCWRRPKPSCSACSARPRTPGGRRPITST